MKMLQPTDRASMLALLGPNDKISAGKLADAMKLFYCTMFEKSSGGAAFKAINDSINPEKPKFSMVNAEMLFKMIWQGFLQDRTSPDELDNRVQQIVIQNMIAFREEHGFPMPADVLEEVRRRVRRHVEAHEEHFAEFRKNYFFIDEFPDNDSGSRSHSRTCCAGRPPVDRRHVRAQSNGFRCRADRHRGPADHPIADRA